MGLSNFAPLGLVGLITLGVVSFNPAATVPSPQAATPIIQLVAKPETSTRSPKRYKIKVTLTSLDDLKVKTGDRVVAGQVLSDRTSQRQQLEAKRRQLEIAIKQMSLPTSPMAELPPPNIAVEEAAIERAKFELHQLDIAPLPDSRFKTTELEQIFDKDVLEKKAKVQEAKARAAMELNQAIASLEKGRTNYQQQQYQHSLNLIQQQTNLQRQQYQLASLLAQQEDVDAKLREIVAVTSPYSGKVRRVKITGQTDRSITAEITINVEKAAE
jgi:biotin carboxyl carrier protein